LCPKASSAKTKKQFSSSNLRLSIGQNKKLKLVRANGVEMAPNHGIFGAKSNMANGITIAINVIG
jgi:hypothetical protein